MTVSMRFKSLAVGNIKIVASRNGWCVANILEELGDSTFLLKMEAAGCSEVLVPMSEPMWQLSMGIVILMTMVDYQPRFLSVITGIF